MGPAGGGAARSATDGWRWSRAGLWRSARNAGSAGIDRDLGSVALLPGLVNAHTHLELSYLRSQVPAADAFVTWIRGVMAARRQRPDPKSSEILDGIRAGIDEAVRTGTALVGDISNTLATHRAPGRQSARRRSCSTN